MCRNVDIIYCTHLYTSVHINGGTNFETKLPRLRAQLGAQGLRRPATWNARTRLVQSPVSCSAQATLCHILYVYIADMYYIYIYIFNRYIVCNNVYIYICIYIYTHTYMSKHIQSSYNIEYHMLLRRPSWCRIAQLFSSPADPNLRSNHPKGRGRFFVINSVRSGNQFSW